MEKISETEQDEECLKYPVLRNEFDKALGDLKSKMGRNKWDPSWTLKRIRKNMVNELFKLISDI